MRNMDELAKKLELVINYEHLAIEYGLFTKKVVVPQADGAPKEYLVFSLKKIKNNVNPEEIIRRRKQHPRIFYPEIFAIEWNAGNPMVMWARISNYLAHAEFMYEVYEEYGAPLPQSIRCSELDALSNFYCKSNDENFDAETRWDFKKGLIEFFDIEKTVVKTKFKKAWHEFYRSSFFDGDRSLIWNFITFLKRDKLQATLDKTFVIGGDPQKVYISEHHYKELRRIMKKRYPEVKYRAGKRQVVDQGILVDPKTGGRAKTPFGITVTDEEYDRIIEERFHKEGFSCIDELTPSIFVGRDVFYKASDEKYLASVSHEITMRWAKCWDLEELKQAGRVNFIEIPAEYMMNLYAGLYENKVPFYVDYRVSSCPNFDTLRIVYNAWHENTVQNILIGLTMMEVNLAHIIMNNDNIGFDINVQKIEKMVQQAKQRKNSR